MHKLPAAYELSPRLAHESWQGHVQVRPLQFIVTLMEICIANTALATFLADHVYLHTQLMYAWQYSAQDNMWG